MLLGRLLLVAIATAWPVLAGAQQADVEVVPDAPPAFDMWNLDSLQDPDIQLPGDEMPNAVEVPDLGSVEIAAPPSSNDSDPCRHFTPEERRMLPTLCGTAD